MNYKTATNFELNKRLAELRGWNICEKQYGEDVVRAIGDFNNTRDWNYCNSWQDAGPVIEELGIIVDGNGMAYLAAIAGAYNYFTSCIGFPLRAAVIVAIQVLENKSEKTEEPL